MRRKFTGKELDDSTGLYDYGARMYDAGLGRFISADMVEPELEDPQTLNRYSYCLNNPLKYVDPTGEAAVMAALAAVYLAVDAALDTVFFAIDTARYNRDPSLVNAASLTLTTACLCSTANTLMVKAGIKGVDKAVDVARAAKVAKRASKSKKIVKAGEEFVHVTPIKNVKKILKQGLKYEKSTWVSKGKYIEDKTLTKIPKALYKKSKQARAMKKYKKGYAVFEVSPKAGNPIYKGITTRPGGVPQWKYMEDVPPNLLKKIR